MMFWDLSQIYFQIDEPIITTLEYIFDIFCLFKESFELFESRVD